MAADTHEKEVHKGERFEFGENWLQWAYCIITPMINGKPLIMCLKTCKTV